jgi:hypothetical protein
MPLVFGMMVLLLAGVTRAATDEGQELELIPAPAPTPALRYRLLPPLLDRTPGNAATLYEQATQRLAARSGADAPEDGDSDGALDVKPLNAWLAVPPADLPRDEVEAFLEPYEQPLDLLRLGARRESCDWEMPLREGRVIERVVAPLEAYRHLGRLVALQMRLAIARGDFPAAVQHAQTGLQFARDLGAAPLVTMPLTGTAVARLVLKELKTLSSQPGAPNLYWAYANLPRPLVSFRTAFEVERRSIVLQWPSLQRLLLDRNPKTIVMQQQVDVGPSDVMRLIGIGPETDAEAEGLDAAAVTFTFPAAARYLATQGWEDDEISATPRRTVVMTYFVNHYYETADAVFKAVNLPYWQGHRMTAAAEDARQADPVFEQNPFALLLGSMQRTVLLRDLVGREIAWQQTLAVLRLHAAELGALPEAVAELAVPLPLDPLTGEPVGYERVDGAGVVSVEAAADGGRAGAARRVEVVLAEE